MDTGDFVDRNLNWLKRGLRPHAKPSKDAKREIRASFRPHRPIFRRRVNELLHQSAFSIFPSYDFDIQWHLLENDFQNVRPIHREVGSLAMDYIQGFIENLQNYTKDGKNTKNIKRFNDVVGRRVIRLVSDELLVKEPDCRVKDGAFEINYDPQHFGIFPHNACRHLANVINNAPAYDNGHPKLPKLDPKELEDDWKVNKEALTKLFVNEFDGIDIYLEANCSDIWRELEKAEKSKRDCNLTRVKNDMVDHIHDHFELVLFEIKKLFKKDKEKVEAFRRRDRHGVITLEVVEDARLKNHNPSCELRADGNFIIQTSPFFFASPEEWVLHEAELQFRELFCDDGVD